MNAAGLFPQSTQLLALSIILSGFAFTLTLTMFLSRDQRVLPMITALVFGAATVLFLYAGTVLALLPNEAPAAVLHLGYNASYVALGAVFVLLGGLALAGWLHSKWVGLVATILSGGAALALISAFTILIR